MRPTFAFNHCHHHHHDLAPTDSACLNMFCEKGTHNKCKGKQNTLRVISLCNWSNCFFYFFFYFFCLPFKLVLLFNFEEQHKTKNNGKKKQTKTTTRKKLKWGTIIQNLFACYCFDQFAKNCRGDKLSSLYKRKKKKKREKKRNRN